MTNNNSNYNIWYIPTYTPKPKDVWHYRFVNDADPIYWKAAEELTQITHTLELALLKQYKFLNNDNVELACYHRADGILALLGDKETDFTAPLSDAQAAYATALRNYNELLSPEEYIND